MYCCPLNSQDMITWYYFSSLVATHFLKHLVGEFGVRSTKHSLPEKFEYTYYLFGGYCMDTFITGKSYVSISSWIKRVQRKNIIHEETMRHKRIILPFCASDDGNNSKNKSMLNCKIILFLSS